MTLEHLVRAAGQRLQELWPERKVRVDKIPKDADGSFFLGVIDSDHDGELDRRFRRSARFEVCYFLQSEDNLDYLAWAETMYDSFRVLEVNDGDRIRRVKLINRKARQDSDQRYYQFLFDVESVLWETVTSGEVMEKLEQREEIST
ncbi:hypothetical protein KL86CLO1_10502 [uncultured Eubacteriales bacterium]|uniref:Uncharacterized protein n=1 Tax=uncultured Eubacteriales bacterium TaxID=172733 RepID=A0A212J4J4_9FIRM|nr:hypothetical protein KL86CLO1_10502 [uncultured Eubacteriales bacterium]